MLMLYNVHIYDKKGFENLFPYNYGKRQANYLNTCILYVPNVSYLRLYLSVEMHCTAIH